MLPEISARFELVELVARGGMGKVYRARDRRAGRDVAVKLLESVDDRDARRFERETEMLAALAHPGIVAHVAHGTTAAGRPYLAMEWLDGEDLRQHLLRVGRPPLGEVLALARALVDVLDFAHGRGIVHRDLKPSNVFLVGGSLRACKVLDFGVARARAEHTPLTRTGVSVGTPGYMAPEQARGGEVDGRADLFALGCVLYECLSGRPAFHAEHVIGMLARILFEEVARLSTCVSTLPASLDELVARLLTKDPAGRYATAREVAAVLASVGEVPRLGAARPAEREALTRGEQRIVSVVVAAEGRRTVRTVRELDTRVDLRLPSGADWTTSSSDARPVAEGATSAEAGSAALTAVAHRHGARVEQLPDGTWLGFLDGSLPEQATRAAEFALGVRDALPNAPVALATGRVELAATVPVGDVIDRAVRVLARAADGEVSLDDVSADVLEAYYQVERAGDGRHVLLRARDPSEGARAVLGRPTPLLGRDRELALLETVWAQCLASGESSAVLVSGPPGIGKSRLVQELAARCQARGEVFGWLFARGDPVATRGALAVLRDALRRIARFVDDDDASRRRDKLRVRFAAALGEGEDEAVELLLELAGYGRRGAPEADALVRGERMKTAFVRWIGREAARAPLLVSIDDLQFCDAPSIQFIEAALAVHPDRPVLVIACARPEARARFPDLFEHVELTELHLRGLAPRAAAELVRSIAPDVDDAAIGRLVGRADGNAFHLEELVRAHVQGADVLPDSVLGMLQARLDGLGPAARRVLRAASVFGRSFSADGVSALVGEPPESVARQLDELVVRELLVNKPAAADRDEVATHDFRHDLVREASYAMLTDADRRLGHRLAGHFLAARGEGDAAVLARHYERGGEVEAASRAYLAAARASYEAGDLEVATSRAERGLSSGAQGPLRGELELVRAGALGWRVENERALVSAMNALALLTAESEAWIRALGEVMLVAAPLGRFEVVDEMAERLLGVGPLRSTDGTRAHAFATATISLTLFGALPRARACASAAEAIERESGSLAASLVDHATGLLSLASGDLGTALARLGRAHTEFERLGVVRYRAAVAANYALALSEVGRVDVAEAILREVLESSTRLGIELAARLARMYLGYVGAARGLDLGASSDARPGGDDRRFAGGASMLLGENALARGALDEAERELARAVPLVAPFPALEARCHALATELHIRRGRPDHALVASDAGMQTLERAGHLLLGEARVDRAHIAALRASGRLADADTALHRAKARLERRCSTLPTEALRRSFLNDVAEHRAILND